MTVREEVSRNARRRGIATLEDSHSQPPPESVESNCTLVNRPQLMLQR